MLNKKLKELTVVEAVILGFCTIMGLISMFCFIMALGVAMSRPAHAAEQQYFLLPDTKATPVRVKIMESHCQSVGKASHLIKVLIDQGKSNQEIGKILTNQVMLGLARSETLTPQLTDDWVAYHMSIGDHILNMQRDYVSQVEFSMLRRSHPNWTEAQTYQKYSYDFCMDEVAKGSTWDVMPVNRIEIDRTKPAGLKM